MSIGVWQLIIVVVSLGGPILGIIRAVDNKSVLHAICSLIIPIYGFFYFFIGRKK